jgi:uncharacterized membrane protein/protein-disulfide isomerase
MSSRARIGLLGSALLGLAASVSAAYVHYQLLRQPGYASFCDFSSTMSCSQVYMSRFGSVGGVPVAVGGAVWFVLVLLLAGSARRGPASFQENVPGYVFALATLALAAILYLGYASFFILKTACILCLLTYVAVIGVFLVSGAATSEPMKNLPGRLMTDLRALVTSPAALVVAFLFMTGAASAVAFFPREAAIPAVPETPPQTAAPAGQTPQAATDPQSEFERWYAVQPRVNLPISAGGAQVLIVKFNDYQCPACAQSYEAYKPIFARYESAQPGQVRFVSLDFPLEAECNNAVPRGTHFAACEAAVAVRLERMKGRSDAMEEWLFTNHARLTPELVRSAAREIGGVTDFDARYAAVLQAVKTDAALASLNNVRSTPTFFINGTMIVGALPPQFFDQAIALELKRAQK